MAEITGLYDLAATFTVEFDGKFYFRVEILRVDNKQDIQQTILFTEIYQLRWPTGALALPSPTETDRPFRPGWQFIDEIPPLVGVSVEGVRDEAIQAISEYCDAKLKNLNFKPARPQPKF